MNSNLAGMQLWHLYYTISLHMKLLMKTWLTQLMGVIVLKTSKCSFGYFFFLGKLFLWLIAVQILCRFYYGKIFFSGNTSVFFIFICLCIHECKWSLVFVGFEKYLATRNKNLFSTSGIHSSPKYDHVWCCLRKLLEKFGQMNSRYIFSRNKEVTPINLLLVSCITYFHYFKNIGFLCI